MVRKAEYARLTEKRKKEIRISFRCWYKNLSEEQKEKRRAYWRRLRIQNKDTEKFKKYHNEYRKQHRLSLNVSYYISTSLKGNKNGMHWEDIVGYTKEQLKNHLEKQFDKKMNWTNYGSYWHIDHITPISWFKFNSYKDKQFKLCWSLKNLRPMYAKDNLQKHNKLILEQEVL